MENQLTIAINFTSSKDVEEEVVTYSRSDNIKFTSCNDANKVVVNSLGLSVQDIKKI